MQRLIKGDKVKVISGKHKGCEGIILSIDTKNCRAIVEGVNFVKKHQKPSQEKQEGGIVEVNAPIHLSKLAIVDPKGKGSVSKIKYSFDKNNKKIRVTKKTNSEINKKK